MKRRIDLMTILGLILCIVLVYFGICFAKNQETQKLEYLPINIQSFWDPSSVAITLGGTVTVLMIMFPASQIKKIPKHLKIIFMPKQYVPDYYIKTLVECAQKARMNGLLALEEDVSQLKDAFLQDSLQMVVDSVDPEKMKLQMESWLDNIDERHAQERSFYDRGAAIAPGFGMIGTLIGLINMLKNLQDVASVGPNMAVALITTFYGSLLANVVFAPISNKLRVRHDEEYLCMCLICEGVQAIQAGENPKLIEDRLLHMLPQYKQKKLKGKSGGEEGGEAGEGKKKEKKEKKEKKK